MAQGNLKSEEKSVRAWYGAVRDAAEQGRLLFEETLDPESFAFRKADLLLRRYLCDELHIRIEDSDGRYPETAEAIEKQVYSEIMEDCAAGLYDEMDTIEFARLLLLTEEGLPLENYDAMLAKVLEESGGLSAEQAHETAEEARRRANARLDSHAEERKKKYNPPPRPLRDDEPPPWLDEFEYIDWVMTH